MLPPLWCLSGQTSSPDCIGPINCICDPLYAPGPLLRVHGESADANGHLGAVVDEVFSLHPTDIQVGERVDTANGVLCTVSAPAPERRGNPAWLGIAAFVGIGAVASRYRKARRIRSRAP